MVNIPIPSSTAATNVSLCASLGGGYSSGSMTPLNETVPRRDQYATLTYFPPRALGPMQSADWRIFKRVMEIVGIALLASAGVSAAGRPLTGGC